MLSRTAGLTIAATLVLGALGCQPQPANLCDRVRIVWAFDEHELTPDLDVSDEPGLQFDILVRTSIEPGKIANLGVTGETGGEIVHPGSVAIADDGSALFRAVDVPTGEVVFRFFSEDDCRPLEAQRSRFVWDGEGMPKCDIMFDPEPATNPLLGAVGGLSADLDKEPVLPNFQGDVIVDGGRAGLDVRIVVLDRTTGQESADMTVTGPDGTAMTSVTLAEGEHAIRAICVGEPTGLPHFSGLLELAVDLTAPDCAIIEPSARVVAGDDLDGDLGNGIQFAIVAQTSSVDAIGGTPVFSVNGLEVNGADVSAVGSTSAVGTVPDNADPQDIVVSLRDLVGNACTATVSF